MVLWFYIAYIKTCLKQPLKKKTKNGFQDRLSLNAGHEGGQWLSGRVFDWRPRGRRFEPHWGHCVVILEQDTFILA